MKKTLIAVTAAIAVSTMAGQAQARKMSDVDNAYIFCQMMDGTGIFSSPCEIDYPNIIVTGDFARSDAPSTCKLLANHASEKSHVSSRWTIQMHSPYANSAVAYCRVP